MLEITGLRRFQMSIQAAKAREEKRVTQAYRDFVTKVFQDLIMTTPQYSGQLTVNWHILLTKETSAPKVNWYKKGHTGWDSSKWAYTPGQRGDGEAVAYAWDQAEPKIAKIRWNTKVSFMNTDPIAESVETNSLTPPLRPVNLVNGQVAMAQYIRNKYSRGEIMLGPYT